ncbi:flagellar protein FlaG [Sulfurimonas sp.]|jgi:flagellar protein FlaG|uniref:flagellar protein FlaG n=1 Tax=Sulfurimonas sp. TaxID=2022749 RepID=UPI0025D48243|nr:flagellar protein FlaG [Sulfurimonas sp.]MBT5934436.1 flagellar protein FlaG [Sulfurimonas sp.]
MDGIANVAKQQQSQVSSSESQGRAAQQIQQVIPKLETVKQEDIVKDIQDASKVNTKINSKEQVRNLVDDLNKAMAPMNTNLRFGVDTQDIFYVSVIESETSKMIRRFPAEEAQGFLPKMQELTGMLFDLKG